MITRNNYEEFFLLYVDNELSPADKAAVERFVDEHPDLKEEWELLLQCRIHPEELPSFSGKQDLFRSEAPIHPGNYEEWFLSYIDNELDAPSRQAVIDFVRHHPEKNIELQQLRQTVSTPDPDIVFPDKTLLYHREEAPARLRRIAWLPFAGIAAAALILGAVGLLIFQTTPQTTPTGRPLASSGGTTAQAGRDSLQTAPTANPGPSRTPALAGTAPSTEKKDHAPVTPRTADPYYLTKKGDGQQKTSATPSGDRTTAPVLAQAAPLRREKDPTGSANVDGASHGNIDPASHGNTDPASHGNVDPARVANIDPVRPARTAGADPGHDVAVTVPKTIGRNAAIPVKMPAAADQAQQDATGNMNASFATQALLSQTSYPDDDSPEETTAYPRKNKLRGIFRKVTRVLEKPAAREDDDNKKVTIGGFQFALK